MRSALPSLLPFVWLAGLLSCGGLNAGSSGGDGGAAGAGGDAGAGGGGAGTCGGGFGALIEPPHEEYPPDHPLDCYLMEPFNGVRVQFPAVPAERGWVLSGTVGDEPFRCAVVPGMTAGWDRCSENRGVAWIRSFDASLTEVRLYAHPCRLSLQLEVDGEPPVSGTFLPEYRWSEPNGAGCGWVGVALVVLSADEG